MALKTIIKVCLPTGNWKKVIDSIMHKGDAKKARPLSECPESIRNKYYVAISYLLQRTWTTYPEKRLKFVTQQTQLLRISNKRWRQIVGSTWDEIRKNLEKLGIIEVDSSYCANSECTAGKPFSKGYRFAPSWHSATFEIAEVKYTQPKKQKFKGQKLKKLAKAEKLHWEALQAKLDKVSLDTVKAREIYEIAKKSKNWNPHQMLVHDILIDGFSNELKAVARTGRIFTDSNMIIAEMRDALRIIDKRTAEVDIVASQPTLLATLYPKNSKEREKYLNLIQSGQIYETIANALSVTRKEAKGLVYQYIFGGKSKRVAEWFQLNFPELATIIEGMKEKELARDLQRKESDVIVLDLMLNSGIDCVSIHDGVRCTVANAVECKRLIIESFERRYGVTPLVTIDYPSDEEEDLAA